MMQELINKLVAEAGLTPAQASQSLEVIKSFVKEKFPMLGGAVDSVFSNSISAAENTAESGEGDSWLDKISDVIPGDLGEKIEGFAKKAADVAEDGFDKVKEVAEDVYAKGKDKAEDLIAKGKQTFDDLEKKV